MELARPHRHLQLGDVLMDVRVVRGAPGVADVAEDRLPGEVRALVLVELSRFGLEGSDGLICTPLFTKSFT